MTELVFLETFLYVLTGAFAGFAAGLLGVGGGLIIVPVLYFIFSTQTYDQQYLMHMALATSLATIVITSISSTLAHHRRQAVLWKKVFILSPGIIIGAWFGGITAANLDTQLLIRFFSIFELLVAINLLLKIQTTKKESTLNKFSAASGGIFIGFVSTIVGIGGGTLTVPFLHWFNIPMRKAVATSAACGFPIALIGSVSYVYASWNIDINNGLPPEHLSLGYLQLYAMAIIATFSFIFAPLGAKVAHTISEKKLRISFACLLLILSITMFVS